MVKERILGHYVIRKIGSKKSVLGVSAALEKEAGGGLEKDLQAPELGEGV